MWQDIIVGIIVAAAAGYLVVALRRATRGETACHQGACTSCPFIDHCTEEPGDLTKCTCNHHAGPRVEPPQPKEE